MTWGECKLIALQTMFSNDGAEINVDDSNKDYVYAMPGKANEAMQQLTTVGRPLLKQFTIRILEGAAEEVAEGSITIPTVEALYKINLCEYIPRFRCVDELKLESGGAYGEAEDWNIEGGSVLVIPGNAAGEYTLWYAAYPQTITAETDDGETLDLPPEAAALVPLYIAAELYKEDELATATMFKNEFEDGLEKMIRAYQATSGFRRGVALNTKGW